MTPAPPTVRESDIAALHELLRTFAAWRQAEADKRESVALQLHSQLDALDSNPDSWHGLKELVGVVDDSMIEGLIRYSVNRSLEQVRERQRDLELEPDTKRRRPTRRRDRDR